MNKKRLLSLAVLFCCGQAAAASFDLATATVADIQAAMEKGKLSSEQHRKAPKLTPALAGERFD